MNQIKKITLTGLMLTIVIFSGASLVSTFSTAESDRLPGIKITIEDPGIGDTAIEHIYEDEYYTYYLTSIRSNSIMLTFEDGLVISLREALDKNIITISDLILNGLNVVAEPKK